MKRPDEEHCRAAFDAYLESRFPGRSRAWQESEAPDYRLTFGAQELGLEVTSIVEMVETGQARLPSLALDASIFRWGEALTARALAANQLSGHYVSYISALRDFVDQRQGIEEAILSFVARTRQLEVTSREALLHYRRTECTIEKVSPKGAAIELLWDGGAKWEGEAEVEIRALLIVALQAKAQKLIAEREPVVLLVLDRYHLASEEVWARAASQLCLPPNFKALIRVSPDSALQLLSGEAVA